MGIKTLNGKDLQADGSTTRVCLCGSSSQKADFEAAAYREALAGKDVLTLDIFSASDGIKLSAQQKQLLKESHYAKIMMAHEVLIIMKPDPTGTLDCDERVGIATSREIGYALGKDKVVNYFDVSDRTGSVAAFTNKNLSNDKYHRVLEL